MKLLYCEKCNFATEESRCPQCGNKKLREVKDDDYCFFVNLNEFSYNMLESALQEQNIEVVGVPCYSREATYATAGRANARQVYIRYKDIDKAIEIYETIFG